MFYVADLIGVGVFAVSGALAAGRKELDLLGVVVLAVVTAIGGGTVRDVLLDRHPVFWIEDPRYLPVTVAAAAFTVLYVQFQRPPLKALLIADALGLALFTISGTKIAEHAGLAGNICVLMGTMTGVAGGACRDVLSNEIPLIMRRGSIYATVAIVGASLYLVSQQFGAAQTAAGIIGMVTIALLRFAASAWEISLPVFSLPDHGES